MPALRSFLADCRQLAVYSLADARSWVAILREATRMFGTATLSTAQLSEPSPGGR